MPPDGKKSFLSLLQDKMIGDHYSVARSVPEIVNLSSKIAEQSSAKRKADAKLLAVDEVKIISVLLIIFSYFILLN
jgi:hypothetical protein